ncbi:MAG: nucleotidyltransferase domain-containing protein [Candidatus Bathyarchaeota archaeon]|nr:nucleotidyltransferase domain-containing protein [Candidatus Bathyarchaeota archaeon]
MAKKPVKRAERVEIIYDKRQWKLLEQLRSKTIQIMETLDNCHLRSIVHGSIARGDVSETSDIDVFLPDPPSSFIIETSLERSGFPVYQRTIVQATPLYALKGYIGLDQQRRLSFPLVKLRPVEKDFYRFGGEASLSTLREEKRVAGVDKRLMLIEPTVEGHVESAVVGREEEVANLLAVSLNTVLDRVRALLRRDEVGRTGVFIEKELAPDETFEQALKKLADQNPAVRRRVKFYQK